MINCCKATSAKRRALNRVYVAGFKTTVLPIASAGASFQVSNMSGKFHGTIAPTTPEQHFKKWSMDVRKGLWGCGARGIILS